MGIDNSFYCTDCKEVISCCFRNGHLYRKEELLQLFEEFLQRHLDHNLLLAADDYWLRIPDAKKFVSGKEKND